MSETPLTLLDEMLRRVVNRTIDQREAIALRDEFAERIDAARSPSTGLGCAECEMHRGDPRGVPPHDHELETTLDVARSTDERLHHHDVNGVALWFQGTGGKPVGGPEDD